MSEPSEVEIRRVELPEREPGEEPIAHVKRAIQAAAVEFAIFQRAFEAAIRNRDSGWLRIGVKVDRGRLILVQKMLGDFTVDVQALEPDDEG